MKHSESVDRFLTVLYQKFGVTKFSVAIATAIIGACAGFAAITIVMPDCPFSNLEENIINLTIETNAKENRNEKVVH